MDMTSLFVCVETQVLLSVCPKNMLSTKKDVVILFNRLLRAETHLGSVRTILEHNAQARVKSLYKHAGQLVYGNVKREKQIWRYEIKEKKTMATSNKSSWIPAFGTREKRFFIQFQLLLCTSRYDIASMG